MKSLPRIIKNGYSLSQGEAVLIPSGPVPPPEPEETAFAEADPAAEQAALLQQEALRRQAESERLLLETQAQCEALRRETAMEAVRLKQQAMEEGYGAALQEKRAEISGCIARVEALMIQLQQSLDDFLEQYRQDVGRLSLDIAGKVLDRRLEEDDFLLRDLVRRAVSAIKKADWIKVEISDQLPGLIEQLRKELDRADSRVDVEGRPVPRGHCVVQTPEGIVDASVATQLENLRETFHDI